MRQMGEISESVITALPWQSSLIPTSKDLQISSVFESDLSSEDRLCPHASQVTIVTTLLHTPHLGSAQLPPMSLVLYRQWHNKYGLAAIHKLIQRTISGLWQFLLLTGIRIMITIMVMISIVITRCQEAEWCHHPPTPRDGHQPQSTPRVIFTGERWPIRGLYINYRPIRGPHSNCWPIRETEAERGLDLDQLPLRLLSRSRMLHLLLDLPSPQVRKLAKAKKYILWILDESQHE